MTRLSTLQILCLLVIPLTAICLGATLIFLAVRCNMSGGLQFNPNGDIVCIRAKEGEQSALDTIAIVVKISIISLIIFTVAISMSICVWFVMKRQQEEKAEIEQMKAQAADVEKLLMAADHVCVVNTPVLRPIYTPPDKEKSGSPQEKVPFTV